MSAKEHRNSLQPGYRIHWYQIEKIIGQGGFGITYLARDSNLNQLVAIKEYLPVELAVRDDNTEIHPVSGEHGEQYKWGLERFISEAQTLAKFKHPNIIRVLAVFRENNSAYMIMEYEQGRGLHEILKEKKTLDEETLKNIVLPIMDGLEQVHEMDFIHRDIKPPNIYIRNDNSPVLLDFGSARQSMSEQTRTLTTLVSPGYAPFEQYVSKSKKQGPWTDIYGLGATLYRSVTSVSPPDSMNRSEAIIHTGKDVYISAREISGGKYSECFLAAIDHAMAFKPEDRPQSIPEWRSELLGESKGATGKDQVKVAPVIGKITPDEEATEKIRQKPLETGGNEKTVNESETVVPEKAGFLDKVYKVVKKLLKWGSILLLILIIIGVINKNRKQDIEVSSEAPFTQTEEKIPEPQTSPPAEIPRAEITEPAGTAIESPIKDNSFEIETLLNNADKDIQALRLTSPAGNNALEKYQQVLELEPGNQRAVNGIDNVVTEYIKLMDKAISSGNLEQAEYYLNKAIEINPDHASINSARQRLANAKKTAIVRKQPTKTPEITSPQTETPVQQDRVPEDVKKQLQELKEKIRKNPGDLQARKQLKAFADDYETRIRQAMESGDYDLAREYVYTLQSITDENSRSYKKLNDLLKTIDTKSKQRR